MRTAAEVAGYVKAREVPYKVWHDPEDRVSAALGVSVLPATVLVDRGGVVSWRAAGAVRADDAGLVAAVEAVLAAGGGAAD